MAGIKEIDVRSTPGYIIVRGESGPPVKHPIKNLLRAGDIPALTHTQVAMITTLANLVVILIRTLTKRGILDEEFKDDRGMDWNLDSIIYAIEQMGGTYHEPDFDDI